MSNQCPKCGAAPAERSSTEAKLDALMNDPATVWTCGSVGDSRFTAFQSDKCHIRELEAEKQRRGELLEEVVTEVAGFGYPESTPNAVGQPVSTEPTPPQLVAHAIRTLKARAGKLEAELVDERKHSALMRLRVAETDKAYLVLEAKLVEVEAERDALKEAANELLDYLASMPPLGAKHELELRHKEQILKAALEGKG